MPFNPVDGAAPAFISANDAALAAQGFANNAAASATGAASSAVSAANPVKYDYNTNTSTSATLTLVYGDIQLGAQVGHNLFLSGAITAASEAILPNVALIVANWAGTVPVQVGQTFMLRVHNSGGSQSGIWTMTQSADASWTLTGNMVVPPNTWRDFEIKFTSLTAATLIDVGAGHYAPVVKSGWSHNTGTSAVQLTYADLQSAVGEVFEHILDLTGSISTAQHFLMPTVAAVVAGWIGDSIVAGQTYKLRVRNVGGTSSGVWTLQVDGSATWSLANTSTATIAVGAWRDYILTFTSLTAGTIQDMGAGVI